MPLGAASSHYIQGVELLKGNGALTGTHPYQTPNTWMTISGVSPLGIILTVKRETTLTAR